MVNVMQAKFDSYMSEQDFVELLKNNQVAPHTTPPIHIELSVSVHAYVCTKGAPVMHRHVSLDTHLSAYVSASVFVCMCDGHLTVCVCVCVCTCVCMYVEEREYLQTSECRVCMEESYT